MDRADAERVFALVAEINGDLRGRIVSERWWLVWIAVGVDMLLACAALQAVLWWGETNVAGLIGLLAGNVLVLFLLIRFIHRRAGGQRTETEKYLWWIWSTKIAATFAVALLELVAGLPPFALAAVFPLFAAFGFSIMAMIADRFFLLYALFFVGTAGAMALFPACQFLFYGTAWCFTLLALGLY